MTEPYPPTDDTTPIRAQLVIDPRDATTRQFRCRVCGALNECPPVAHPPPGEKRTTALEPKSLLTLGPLSIDAHDPRSIAETRKQMRELPPEAAPGT